jgi:CHAT domain-containing protein
MPAMIGAFPHRLLPAAVLAMALAGCAQQPAAVPQEEARGARVELNAGNAFAAPPRTVSDITAILDQEKPDPARIAAARRTSDAQPPAGVSGAALARFLQERGDAANDLGRNKQALADLARAYDLAKQDPEIGDRRHAQILSDLARMESAAGSKRAALAHYREEIDFWEARDRTPPMLLQAYRSLAGDRVVFGDPDAANEALAALDDIRARAEKRRSVNRAFVEGIAEAAHGEALYLAGRFRQAVPHLRQAAAAMMQAEDEPHDWPPQGTYISSADVMLSELATALAKSGHPLDAEVEARRALLNELRLYGRYSVRTAARISVLAEILTEQGRYPEAETLVRIALDTYAALEVDQASVILNRSRETLGTVLVADERWAEAIAQFRRVRTALADEPDRIRQLERRSPDFPIALLKSGQPREAAELAQRILEDRTHLLGEKHYGTAEATGIYAAALAAAGDIPAARAAFARSLPRLLYFALLPGNDGTRRLRDKRLRIILEAYLDVLAADGGGAAAAEAFRIADVARGRSVQRALAESAARGAVGDPALADLVRREQDAAREAEAEIQLLANAYALPPDQRDDTALAKMRAGIDHLAAEAEDMRAEIQRRFPAYARLTNPPPATAAEVQAALAPGEALVAVYVAADRSYVWAVPKTGPVAFAARRLSRAEIEKTVAALRRAVDPNAAVVEDVPAFDLALSYRLYRELLEPVKAGWTGAKQLLVVPHGALGELPFALLTTAPAEAKDAAGQAIFSGYRGAPWLIRQTAITQLPSVASLLTLRGTAERAAAPRPFVGFGDPWFTAQQAERDATQLAAADSAVAVRGVHIRLRSAPRTESAASAELALLPPLPETAREVREVAAALGADPARDVYLGARANEEALRNAKLDDRRVVMFATHGLVPGDLDGLSEAALALSAPQVAHAGGDGLLTVSKILGLRLNADWVVLSACNTAAGNGAGAEAVSGLGLAFFYAGSRALLVSNWPVETTAAQQLTTDLFRREVASPGIARSDALRQAMLALIDGPGRVGADGRSIFSYAHPIFWAPFALVGDGGRPG